MDTDCRHSVSVPASSTLKWGKNHSYMPCKNSEWIFISYAEIHIAPSKFPHTPRPPEFPLRPNFSFFWPSVQPSSLRGLHNTDFPLNFRPTDFTVLRGLHDTQFTRRGAFSLSNFIYLTLQISTLSTTTTQFVSEKSRHRPTGGAAGGGGGGGGGGAGGSAAGGSAGAAAAAAAGAAAAAAGAGAGGAERAVVDVDIIAQRELWWKLTE